MLIMWYFLAKFTQTSGVRVAVCAQKNVVLNPFSDIFLSDGVVKSQRA